MKQDRVDSPRGSIGYWIGQLLDALAARADLPEQRLAQLEFPGALVLVTHDRYLLDRVSTRILALDGRGGVVPYADYTQWEIAQQAADVPVVSRPRPSSSSPSPRATTRKLRYREQQEWDRIEAAIESAEQAVTLANAAVADPSAAADHVALQERLRVLNNAQAEVERLYARWVDLEAKLKG